MLVAPAYNLALDVACAVAIFYEPVGAYHEAKSLVKT